MQIAKIAAIFCGGRLVTDSNAIMEDVKSLPDGSVVIQGGANGADKLAGLCAFKCRLSVHQIDADWYKYGKGAGFRRNARMLSHLKSLEHGGYTIKVYAYFKDGEANKGTTMMCDLAEKDGIEVIRRIVN